MLEADISCVLSTKQLGKVTALLGRTRGESHTPPMSYLKPPKFASKIFNPIAVSTGIGGSEKLTVRGRNTGAPQSIPASGRGGRGPLPRFHPWRVGMGPQPAGRPAVVVSNKSGATTYRASELPVSERAPVIAAYREKAGKQVRGYWAKLPEDADHPVFALTTAQ